MFHFVYTPEYYSSLINKILIRFKSKKSIQTIPTRIKRPSSIKKLIFANKVVTISNFTKNLLLKNGIKNVVKINTGIDTNYFKPFKKNQSLLKKFNLFGKTVILIPIDLEKKKGSRKVLNIIKSTNNLKNVMFIFSYISNKKRNLEEKFLKNSLLKSELLKKVLFIKDPKDIKNLINISDIIIYPVIDTYGKHETPMVLIEAMSMEKPIIISDVPPLNEIIKGNEGIKTKNYLDMKNSLLKLVKDKTLRRKIGKLARKRVVNNFNIVKTVKEYNKLYKQML